MNDLQGPPQSTSAAPSAPPIQDVEDEAGEITVSTMHQTLNRLLAKAISFHNHQKSYYLETRDKPF